MNINEALGLVALLALGGMAFFALWRVFDEAERRAKELTAKKHRIRNKIIERWRVDRYTYAQALRYWTMAERAHQNEYQRLLVGTHPAYNPFYAGH